MNAPRAALPVALVVAAAASAGVLAQDGRLPGLELATVPPELEGHEYAPRARPLPDERRPLFDPEDPDREWFGRRSFPEWERLTGEWGGARARLEDAGLTISSSFILDWSSAWSGGISSRATRRTLFDFNMTLDLERAAGWEGGTVFVDFYSTNKSGGSADVGDFQGFSNIETDRSLDQIAEVWFEQVSLSGALRFKVGKIDANSEFGFIDSAGDFLNSSAGLSPTVFALPTYPDPAFGVVAQVFPTESSFVSLGVFDGAATVDGVRTGTRGPSTFFSDDLSDDYFLIAEGGLDWEFSGARAGRFSLGAWHHTGKFDTFDGGTQSGATGFYALAEQRLWTRDLVAEDSDRGVYAFGQFGWADKDVSEAEIHLGAGLSTLGTFRTRDDDSAGVYLSWVKLNRDAGFTDDEFVVELFYRAMVTPAVSLTPDLQIIVNPGGDSGVDTAIVASIRLEIVF